MKSIVSLVCLLAVAGSLLTCKVDKYPPEIWQSTPIKATIGQEVLLSGAQFGSDPVVTFGQGGTAVQASIRQKTDQTITVLVPRVGVGVNTISVQNGQGITDPLSFTVLQPPPSITAITPINGLAGTPVVIAGDYLDRLSSVKFGDVSATVVGTGTPTSITVTVPPNLPRARLPLLVETEGGRQAGEFYAVATPIITGFSPKRIRSGGEVVITGKYLLDAVVCINGLPTDPLQTRVQETEIRALVPPTATTGKLSVTVFNKITATTPDSLYIAFAPAITRLNVTEGIKGDRVLISGRSLRDITSVTFGNTATTFQVVSDTLITALVPERPQSGEVNVTVNGLGGSAFYFVPFLVVLPPANIAFDPLRRARGKDVTINGQNLHRIREVRVNGKLATIISRIEGSEVRINVPADATTGAITLSNAAGSATSTRNLAVIQRPVIADFTRKAAVGSRVVIKGDFLQDARIVFSNSAGPAINDGRNDDTEVWVRVPADAQNGAILVLNETNEPTYTDVFTVQKSPTQVDFTPRTAKLGGEITITGQNLADVTEVRFGTGASAPAAVRRETSATGIVTLKVTVPATAIDGLICLVSPTGTVCPDIFFNVLQPVSGLDFTPKTGKIGIDINFAGLNLSTVTEVKFSGGKSTAAAFHMSGQFLVATVPADAVTGPICLKNDAGTVCTTVDYVVTK